MASNIFDRLFSLQGKSVLVTGASGGIGRALSIAYGEAGALVGLHGTNEANLNETLKQVEAAGGRGIVITADLSNADSAKSLIERAVTELGSLDVLVNNAGMNRRMPAVDYAEGDYDAIMAVNLKSLFFLCQAAQPVMKAQGGGKIINIGSMTSYIGVGNVAIYGMTKAAVGQLSKTLALEWARDNIQVNCLCPGFIKTPLTAQGQWADPHISGWILDRVAAKRPGVPEDLVGAALLLATNASDFITGQLLAVDGGFLAGGSWAKD